MECHLFVKVAVWSLFDGYLISELILMLFLLVHIYQIIILIWEEQG